jgi:hypothetical protein
VDRIFEAFLHRQHADGMALAEASDLLELSPLGAAPARRYLAHFNCRTLIRSDRGEVGAAGQFAVGIWFPDDYLRRCNPAEVVTWLAPANAFHPNIRPPFICLGRMTPGVSLVDLLYQVHEIGVGAKLTVREDDALDPVACKWARRHRERFWVDRRPIKRATLDFALEEAP